ncbi:MAG: rhodanese-like domain-containing protein [Candidatus Magasanikbacteria bacterium]|nr:rhodanese-like domain-containing protein [Candidatus Magasanikbacteria bacterium]
MQKALLLSLLAVLLLWTPQKAQAIPAPEIVTSVITQGMQLFGFFTALLLSFLAALSARFSASKYRMVFIVVFSIIIGILIGGGVLYWWLNARTPLKGDDPYTATSTIITATTTQTNVTSTQPITEFEDYQLYKAQEEQLVASLVSKYKTSPQESAALLGIAYSPLPQDTNSQFVASYYEAVDHKQFSKAFAMTGAASSEAELISWYQNALHIDVLQMKPVSATQRQLLVAIREYGVLDLYEVVQEVLMTNGQAAKLKLLSSKKIKTISVDEKAENSPLAIKNAVVGDWIKEKNDIVILDARENLERKNGYIPGSIHVRGFDAIEHPELYLPLDKPIVVYCWSGGRGSEIASALRDKGYQAYALENGVNSWVNEYHGIWTGTLSFFETYPQFADIKSKKDWQKSMQKNPVVIDAREEYQILADPQDSIVRIPLFSTSNTDVENSLALIPKNSSVTVICQQYANCFGAKIIAQTLYMRGYQVLGAYDLSR